MAKFEITTAVVAAYVQGEADRSAGLAMQAHDWIADGTLGVDAYALGYDGCVDPDLWSNTDDGAELLALIRATV